MTRLPRAPVRGANAGPAGARARPHRCGSCRAGWSPGGSGGPPRCRSGRAARATSSSDSGIFGSTRVEEATLTVASGVCRSWETAPTIAWRRRSTSSRSSERSAWSRRRARSRASAAWFTKERSSTRSSSASGMERSASRPTGSPPAISATVWSSSGTADVVPSPTGTPERGSRPRSSAPLSASPADAAIRSDPPDSGSGTRSATPGTSKRCATARTTDLSRSSVDRSSTRRSERSRIRRASSALARASALAASRRDDQVRDEDHHHGVDDQRHQILRLLHGKAPVRRDEEQVEDQETGDDGSRFPPRCRRSRRRRAREAPAPVPRSPRSGALGTAASPLRHRPQGRRRPLRRSGLFARLHCRPVRRGLRAAAAPVEELFRTPGCRSDPVQIGQADTDVMADFLVVLGIVGFAVGDARR